MGVWLSYEKICSNGSLGQDTKIRLMITIRTRRLKHEKPTYKELEDKLLRNERFHLKASIIIFLIMIIAVLYFTVHYTKVEKELR